MNKPITYSRPSKALIAEMQKLVSRYTGNTAFKVVSKKLAGGTAKPKKQRSSKESARAEIPSTA
jgi:hypothetical protein